MADQPKILVVEDDESILANMADLLRSDGYEVLMATNGLAALRVLQYHQPDLILSDIMMPEMDGYQFLDTVREDPVWLTIPFIFLSAKGERKDIHLGYEMGVEHYITKPFDPDDLLLTVRSRLKRSQEIKTAVQDDVELMKNQLISVFSHELRTPLNWIYGYMGMLQEGHTMMEDEVVDKMLNDMQRGVDRLLKLSDDLMLVVMIDSGMVEKQISKYSQSIPITQRIEAAIHKLRSQADKRNITFTVPVNSTLKVYGISDYIDRILLHLIENAMKFSKPGGHVRIGAEAEEDRVIILVRDEGIGIAPEQMGKLFIQFQQINREKMEQQGVGLGLTIVKGLVELHKGEVKVESQPNMGSTFTINLPIG